MKNHQHQSNIQTHYNTFHIKLPLDCLLPPYDTDKKFENEIQIEVFYWTQHPSVAQIYDYRVNPFIAEMLYWPEVNLYVIGAVENNCESFWEEQERIKQSN